MSLNFRYLHLIAPADLSKRPASYLRVTSVTYPALLGRSTVTRTFRPHSCVSSGGSSVKRLPLFSITFLLAAIGSGTGQTSNPQPVSCTELTAWIVGGISTNRLTQLLSERGLAFPFTAASEKQLRTAGAEGPLLKALHTVRAVNAPDGKTCSAALTKAAESVSQKHYEDAEKKL